METLTEQKTFDGNVNETTNSNSNSKLVEREEIKNTPFTAVKFEDKWFLTMGKYRLTDGLASKEDVINEAKDASWFRIMQIIQIMIDEDKNKIIEMSGIPPFKTKQEKNLQPKSN